MKTAQHFMEEDLQASGIPLEYAKELGIGSLTDALGYYIPYHFWDSGKAIFGDNGKPFGRTKTQSGAPKYRQASGSGIRPYVIPEAGEYYHANPKVTLYLTEGEKKAIAATIHGFPVIALGGIWNWIDKKAKGHGKRLHQSIANWVRGRSKVVMIFDSDGVGKDSFNRCAQALAAALIPYSVDLYVAFVPSVSETNKTGIDDWIVENNLNAPRLKQIINDITQKVKCTDPWNIDIPTDIEQLDISESEYRLLYVISKCANEKGKYSGWCRASKDYLAAAIGRSRRQVIRLKKELIDAEYLLDNPDNEKLLKTRQKARSMLRRNIKAVIPEEPVMSESVTSPNVTIFTQNENFPANILPSKCDMTNNVTQYVNGGQKEKNNKGIVLEHNNNNNNNNTKLCSEDKDSNSSEARLELQENNITKVCSEQKGNVYPEVRKKTNSNFHSSDRKPDKTYARCNRCQQDQPIKWKPEPEREKDYRTWFRCEVCGSDNLSIYMTEKQA